MLSALARKPLSFKAAKKSVASAALATKKKSSFFFRPSRGIWKVTKASLVQPQGWMTSGEDWHGSTSLGVSVVVLARGGRKNDADQKIQKKLKKKG